ncbi:hypothetical protein [Clostridium sp. D33t1_170424_F3]|uniref:hypothetical protein n=1 Tax=Clostridium sp. D33t1_170424_F3 TaxID=2787099 RepID=UPI0018AAC624|nr:hypothetical protein [Clostridium sp. D33t1_170424_F3]
MEHLEVIPNKGIGPLRLGMSEKEIFFALEQLRTKWTSTYKSNISKASDTDPYTRYQDGSSFFMVRYKNNKAIEIAVDYELREKMIIDIYGMDVFNTLAEELVSNLKKYSTCTYDMEDEQLSTNYEFEEIGVRLWREDAFHPKLFLDESYMNEMKLVIEEQQKYLYFQLIAVKSL